MGGRNAQDTNLIDKRVEGVGGGVTHPGGGGGEEIEMYRTPTFLTQVCLTPCPLFPAVSDFYRCLSHGKTRLSSLYRSFTGVKPAPVFYVCLSHGRTRLLSLHRSLTCVKPSPVFLQVSSLHRSFYRCHACTGLLQA